MSPTASTVGFNSIAVGDPAPWFVQRSTTNPAYSFSTAAGRYIVMCFFGTASDTQGTETIEFIKANHRSLDDTHLSVYGVTTDPDDEANGRVRERIPGIRFFLDYDGRVSRLYGSIAQDADADRIGAEVRRFWIVLDPTMRVIAVIPFKEDGSDRGQLLAVLQELPPVGQFLGFEIMAPILVLPNVFESDFCTKLIGLYQAHGGTMSGFMREVDGKTVALQDPGHKKRRDYVIKDQQVIRETQQRITRRIVPEILKVHQFKVTRMERYIVSCYSADEGGHFGSHRDNTTKGTAHRRFAVSINLNSEFDGGQISFPEYGPRSFKPPPGGAVVFSCSLLHAVSKVTRGQRYAFLPFLYDDVAAKIRQENNAFMAAGLNAYKA